MPDGSLTIQSTETMKTFNYASTSSIKENLTSLILGVALIVIPIVYPFGIRIGRMPILGATATTIIFVVGGLALLTFTVREIMQARKLIAQGGEITVDGDLVTIPVVKKGTVTNESFRLPDVEYTKFDAEENEFTISLPAAHHVIRGAFFESSDAFDAFKSTFK